jgi:hypothetical protein
LKRTSTAIGFLFFIFDLEYLIRAQSSEPLYAKMNAASCLFGSRFACAHAAIFYAELCSKNAGETSIVLWITAREYRIPTFRNPNKKKQHFGGFFHSAPANRNSGFYANHVLNSRRLDSILHEADQNFEVFSNI